MDMVQYSIYLEWYHQMCEHIPASVLNNFDLNFNSKPSETREKLMLKENKKELLVETDIVKCPASTFLQDECI